MQRRKLLQDSLLLGSGLGIQALLPAWAQSERRAPLAAGNTLTGPLIDLEVSEVLGEIDGRPTRHIALNDQLPAPLLRWREGEDITLRVHNRLREDTSIHWHGLLLPFQMDGVPGVSFPGIKAGETFTYRFPVRQSGTYWYHSHSGFQEQLGHYGPIIIDPREPGPIEYDREHVVVLSDWTFEGPERVFAKLKAMSENYNFQQRTVADFFQDVKDNGLDATLAERMMWGRMRMSPTDIADVSAATFTFLINGHSPAENWTGLFHPGERVRLRVINASAMSIFNVRIPGLPLTVVQADGLDVQPVETDEFQIGVAETFDVMVQPVRDEAYTLMCESNDRSGYARATLAPRPGMSAAVPPLRERPTLSMRDMGMAHEHTASANSEMGQAHTGHTEDQSTVETHAGHADMQQAGDMASTSGAMHSSPGQQAGRRREGEDHSRHSEHSSMQHGGENHAAHASGDSSRGDPSQTAADPHASHGPPSGSAADSRQTEEPVRQAHSHPMGPGVAGIAEQPVNRLGERPLGLEEVPHRVLVYSDLRSLKANPDTRAPEREIELHLTSNMERYMWSFDGRKFSEVEEPIVFHEGERLRLTMVNDTMMPHPIHLHGMFFDLVNGQQEHKPRKHTIVVKPGEKLSVDITAEAVGDWAFHCHLLYHMMAGMMQVVSVRASGGRA